MQVLCSERHAGRRSALGDIDRQWYLRVEQAHGLCFNPLAYHRGYAGLGILRKRIASRAFNASSRKSRH